MKMSDIKLPMMRAKAFGAATEAKTNKRYAESHGHKQKIAKLVFEDFVR